MMSIDTTQLPPALRPSVADGYRELAEANRYLYAQTGTAHFLARAIYAEGKVAELTYGGSVDWEAAS
jgi:hypothetical protein